MGEADPPPRPSKKRGRPRKAVINFDDLSRYTDIVAPDATRRHERWLEIQQLRGVPLSYKVVATKVITKVTREVAKEVRRHERHIKVYFSGKWESARTLSEEQCRKIAEIATGSELHYLWLDQGRWTDDEGRPIVPDLPAYQQAKRRLADVAYAMNRIRITQEAQRELPLATPGQMQTEAWRITLRLVGLTFCERSHPPWYMWSEALLHHYRNRISPQVISDLLLWCKLLEDKDVHPHTFFSLFPDARDAGHDDACREHQQRAAGRRSPLPAWRSDFTASPPSPAAPARTRRSRRPQ
jgi:hypothetical protein